MDYLTGLQLIAQGTSWTDRALDIITIHGFQGYDTWEYRTHGDTDNSKTVFWARDFLPKDLPAARIFTYRYLSTAFCDGQGITKAANKLLNKLKNLQADNTERSRPLVFICHSVGGLILQCALSEAFDSKGDTALNEIVTATQGIIFLGTPHSTTDIDASVSRIAAASEINRSIMVGTQFMAQVLVRFASLSQYNPPWKVVYCYEELPLPGSAFRGLCRFRSRDDASYIKVLQSLRNITSGLSSPVEDEIEVQTTFSSVEQGVLESLETEDTSTNIGDASPGTCEWILNHNTYKSWFAKPSEPLWITDALDECDDPAKLVTFLCRLNDFSPSRQLRICISSRPSNLSLPGAEIRLEDNNSLDIEQYLSESLLAMEDYLFPASNVQQKAEALTEKAEGVFLWASLTISQLRFDGYLKIPKSEQHSTSSLPTTLDAAYEAILQQLWSRHDVSRRRMAQDAFALVLCAQRPLSILELRSALAAMHYNPDLLSPRSKIEVNDWGRRNKMSTIQDKGSLDMSMQLMLLCGGLLEVAPRKANSANDKTDTEPIVQFVHYSVSKYFQERGSCVLEGASLTSKLSFPELKSTDLQAYNAQYHYRIAWICLFESAINSAAFLEYSLRFGMAHLGLADRAGGFVDQWSLLHSRVFKHQKLFEPHKTKAVHVMSYYGLPWFDTGLWGASLTEIDEEDRNGHTPLSLAAAMGHHHICEILLDNGANLSHRDYIYGQTPLSYAAAYGHREVVEILLSKGSDYEDSSSGVTPLWLASRSGHLDIAELLLLAGANPNASSIHTGEACLSHAASLGHTRSANQLLARGAKVDTRDKNGWTPLHHAVSRGRKKIIQLLLGVLKSQELLKLKKNLSEVKSKSSWIHTVLSAIVILACYQCGSEWQTPAVGNQNNQALNQCSEGLMTTKQGINRQKHKLEDGNEENIKGRSEKRHRRAEPNGDRFACPYHEKNRARFASGPCNGQGFENIDRLKWVHL
ncbi:hypothetical protein FPRO06_00069 [Fusarium proliferatum]|nr:hypothetical protein FPRO06_00069 [Fusarium proliferatum]